MNSVYGWDDVTKAMVEGQTGILASGPETSFTSSLSGTGLLYVVLTSPPPPP